MDQLSRALAETHLRGSLLATIDVAAPWGIDFEQSIGIPVHYVIEGGAWLQSPGLSDVQLAPGDLVMFPRWDRHYLTSDPQFSDHVAISEIVRRNDYKLWSQGEWLDEPLLLTMPGSGPRTRLLSMVVELVQGATDLLVLGLPRTVHIRSGDDAVGPWVGPVLQFLANEAARRDAGYAVVQSRLSELLFMQVVRSQLLVQPSLQAVSLHMLLDPAIGRVAAALRERPGYHWTLAEMARVGGLSRSAFAKHFSELAGMTPFEFLRSLRLDAAAERLKRGEPVKALVEDIGYRTLYSFAKAFRARYGTSPAAYRAQFRASRT